MTINFAMKVVYFMRPWCMPLNCFMSTIAYSLYIQLPTGITQAIGSVVHLLHQSCNRVDTKVHVGDLKFERPHIDMQELARTCTT